MTDEITLTKLVRIYPNSKTRKFIKRNIAYRHECWNAGIRTWEHMYHEEYKHLKQTAFTPELDKKNNVIKINVKNTYFKDEITVNKPVIKNGEIIGYKPTKATQRYVPSGSNVRDQQVRDSYLKETLDKLYPNEVKANVLRTDLDQSYQAFFDPARPDSKKPKIKHQITDNGSYLDTQAKIKEGCILPSLNRYDPHFKHGRNRKGIRVSEDISNLNDSDKRRNIRFIHCDGKFYAAIAVKYPVKHLMKTGLDDAVDANVDHFNSAGCIFWLSKQKLYDYKTKRYVYKSNRLDRYYEKVAHYQRVLANKRNCRIKHSKKMGQKVQRSLWQSKNYKKIQLKLRKAYLKVSNIQHDLVQKYTTYLVKYHDTITIEDLAVKHMQMSHVASKGLHRSLFGYFRRTLEYKCKLYGRKLIVAHKLYASTQTCPRCGMAKAGDNKIKLNGNAKHKTGHYDFICYYCGYKADRDVKVTPTLMRYNPDSMPAIIKAQRKGQDYQTLGMI